MGFISFAGRALFASVFLLSAYKEFSEYGTEGGPAAKSLRPKYDMFIRHVTSILGIHVPNIEVKHLIIAFIALKGIGGLLFILSSSLGACLLLVYLAITTPILYNFYNYGKQKSEFALLFANFTQNLALFGALLFYLGMKNSISKKNHVKKKAPKQKTT
ncbi:hypothetical protein AXF42_Ash000880 [Apostasia shenzhenica]|uniref:HR-like lesion-inducer n=1 Tax=Apostasia shenzhenica TaxID=1088818 RepID=A0A2I0ATC3_9ASPA|nr:hypothetical protein AXF42_Ash000880 [Apostasia shenzhenica]